MLEILLLQGANGSALAWVVNAYLLTFGGLMLISLALIATARVEPGQAGLVSGLLSTSQMIGGAIGLAVLAAR